LVVKHILPGMGLFFYFVLHFNCKFAQLKQEYPYLKDSDATSFLVVSHNLVQAFKMLFKHRGGYPRFKSRHAAKQSYTGRSVCTV
ncbi:hypothetical protein LR965_10315, partial [Limosilactobacillus fermentum]|nr:hypothetical protein [Limosilactobacillus fermentum]